MSDHTTTAVYTGPERRRSRSAVVCPSCSMQASPSDVRLLRPVSEELELRRCRNCQAVIDLSSDEPMIAQPLSSV